MGDLFICSISEKPIFASFTRCTFPTNTLLLISLDFRVGCQPLSNFSFLYFAALGCLRGVKQDDEGHGSS